MSVNHGAELRKNAEADPELQAIMKGELQWGNTSPPKDTISSNTIIQPSTIPVMTYSEKTRNQQITNTRRRRNPMMSPQESRYRSPPRRTYRSPSRSPQRRTYRSPSRTPPRRRYRSPSRSSSRRRYRSPSRSSSRRRYRSPSRTPPRRTRRSPPRASLRNEQGRYLSRRSPSRTRNTRGRFSRSPTTRRR